MLARLDPLRVRAQNKGAVGTWMGSFLCPLGWQFEMCQCISAHTALPCLELCCHCDRQSHSWPNSGSCPGLGQQLWLTQFQPLKSQKFPSVQGFDGCREASPLLHLCPLQESLSVTTDTGCPFQRPPEQERRGFSHTTGSLQETRRVKP